MQVLIIEDESPAAIKLEAMLLEYDKEVHIAGKLQSVAESINWLHENHQPDLIFMDIQLDDGVCFEIFDSFKIETPIIFTTAYDNYAIKAFEVNSIDYLLKPIDRASLFKAIEKYERLFINEVLNRQNLNQLLRNIVKSYKTRFFVKVGNHYSSVPVENIDCFFIRERAIFLRTNEGKNYDLDYSLDQLQKATDPSLFFRINRNYLVNINSIQDIYSYSTSRLGIKLKMMDHLDLIVSREKVADFKNWLDR